MAEKGKADKNGYYFATNAIHAGQKPDPTSGAVMIPISLSTTFVQKSPGVNTGFEYARTGNPTRDAFENCVAALENGVWAAAFASGLAATATISRLFSVGDEIICFDDVYGGTRRFFTKIGEPSGLVSKYVDLSNVENLKAAITPRTKMVWAETPTNPTLKLCDIKAICDLAHQHGIIVAVDNTFMTPFFQRPLDLGADLVVHSVTKYLNGHSDVVMGIVIGNSEELRTRLKYLQNAMGAIPSPFDSFLAIRSLKTLHVRMERHAQNALAVAQFLEKHPKVEKVMYPGLPSHPQHALAKKQMTGFGGMVTIWLKGGLAQSRLFLETVKLFALAESLGGVESLIEHPGIMTHASVPAEARAALGISDSLVRLSVGIEDIEDILNDLRLALDKITV